MLPLLTKISVLVPALLYLVFPLLYLLRLTLECEGTVMHVWADVADVQGAS